MNKLALTIDNKTISPPTSFKPEFTDLGSVITASLNLIFYISGMLLFIWLAWGIMQYIFAGGNKEALAKARTRIIYALVGFIIVVLSFTLSEYIKAVLSPTSSIPQPPITPITPP
ncbi:hypothetical protein HYW46_06745 [Candidatus Daviesbacteria bacterium]|nr:hypothetical protein [Candidatus Daviesbacteria bacterium]